MDGILGLNYEAAYDGTVTKVYDDSGNDPGVEYWRDKYALIAQGAEINEKTGELKRAGNNATISDDGASVYVSIKDLSIFACSSSLYIKICNDLEERAFSDGNDVISSGLTEAERKSVEDMVNGMFSDPNKLYSSDKKVFISKIQNHIDTLTNNLNDPDNLYTDKERNEREYEIALCEQKIKDLNLEIINEEYRKEIEEKSKEMTDEELQNEIEAINSRLAEVGSVPNAALEAKYGEPLDIWKSKQRIALEVYTSEIGARGVENAEEIKNGIFYQPEKVTTGSSSEENLDDVINDADDFLGSAIAGGIGTVDQTSLQKFSGTLYNVLLSIGVAVAVIVGALLGIKLMAAGVDEKAEVKNLIIPYVAGCIVVFGGFTIWKIVVEILSAI